MEVYRQKVLFYDTLQRLYAMEFETSARFFDGA